MYTRRHLLERIYVYLRQRLSNSVGFPYSGSTDSLPISPGAKVVAAPLQTARAYTKYHILFDNYFVDPGDGDRSRKYEAGDTNIDIPP